MAEETKPDPIDIKNQDAYIDASRKISELNEQIFEIVLTLVDRYPYYRFEIPNGELYATYAGLHRDEEQSLADIMGWK